MVDTISSLASIDYRHDEWGVDVTVAGSQKGLMLPPGLSFNAISDKALKATESARLPRSYWDWRPMLEANKTGYFPYTPGTNLLFGLNEAVKMLLEEGLPNVFARHDRHAEATRRAVRAWGLEMQCADPRHYSSSLTAVRVPEGHSADALRADHPGQVQHEPRQRARHPEGPRVPHRPSRRFRRPATDRHAGRRGDGAARGRRAAQAGRRAGGDRLSGGECLTVPQTVCNDREAPMIEVWTWPTPNGHKVHIALEELGLPYKVIPINIGKGDQFKPEFLAITPNHRIPAIVDPDGPGGKPLTLFESAAIMIYLSEKTGGKLIPKDPVGRYKCLEWMMFQMGGVGPMFGQYNHFANYAVEKLPYAIERYTNEVARLHRVLDKRLAEATWLAGDEYSMADIITFPWIRNPERATSIWTTIRT